MLLSPFEARGVEPPRYQLAPYCDYVYSTQITCTAPDSYQKYRGVVYYRVKRVDGSGNMTVVNSAHLKPDSSGLPSGPVRASSCS